MLVHDAPRTIETRWSRATLVAFRFAFVCALVSSVHVLSFVGNYLWFDALQKPYNRAFEVMSTTTFDALRRAGTAAIRAATGFGSSAEAITARYTPVGCFAVGLLVIAAAATAVWTVIDRRRTAYVGLHRWLRVYARYALAMGAMVYAVVKVVPTQFGFLTPGELLRPVGNLNRFWVLWDFMVVSTGYTIFAGLAELLGCSLLFFRRTTLAGALILGAALTNVLAMDLAYHLFFPGMIAADFLLLAGIIVAPYARALADVVVFGRTAMPPEEPQTPLSRRRYAALVSLAILATLVAVRVQDGLEQRRQYFGRTHSVWGMFDVDRFVRNGVPVTPLASDNSTWKRIASHGRYDSNALMVQFADASVESFGLVEDAAKKTWSVKPLGNRGTPATFTFATATDGSLTLDGHIGADAVQMHLHPVDLSRFPLLRDR